MNTRVRVDLERAYVLHHRPYRESSAIVEAFTSAHGRVGLVARGARGPRSRLKGALQAFRPVLLSWCGHGELMTLTGVDLAQASPPVEGRTLFMGFYLNELLVRLLHRGDPHPELFGDYARTLEQLMRGESEESTLRIFEKRLLDAIGYGLSLDADAQTGEPLDSTRRYVYVPEQGPVAAAGCHEGVEVGGNTLIALRGERVEGEVALREVKRLMRAALDRHLGGRALESRRLFRELGRAERTRPAS